MATVTNNVPNLTLMRLKAMHPVLFYPQDWYHTEEFAHRPLEIGEHRLYVDYDPVPPSAVACVYYFLYHIRPKGIDLWAHQFVWTSDYDARGDRIYVGGWNDGGISGFQIHRHLTLRNVVEVGYTFDGK